MLFKIVTLSNICFAFARKQDLIFHAVHAKGLPSRWFTWNVDSLKYFSYFCQKIGFDLSGKLSPQTLFTEEEKYWFVVYWICPESANYQRNSKCLQHIFFLFVFVLFEISKERSTVFSWFSQDTGSDSSFKSSILKKKIHDTDMVNVVKFCTLTFWQNAKGKQCRPRSGCS